VQPLAVGVIVYVTVFAVVEVLSSVSLIGNVCESMTAALLMPSTFARDHLNVVPVTVPCGLQVNGTPGHIVVGGVVVNVTSGTGYTVTVTVFSSPVQPFAVGVIVYVTVFAVVEVLVSISLTGSVCELTTAALLMPSTFARDHLNVVPVTVLVGL
jgi:hypothetical protein